jgi:hypothetical protein
MDPEDTLEQHELEENKGVNKSSHTKHPTTCNDVRRGGEACGICGSYNIVDQGVRYCKSCNLEVEWLGDYQRYWWNGKEENPICNCPHIMKDRWKVSPRDSYSILKCIDCGAVNSTRLCPNCGSKNSFGSNTWKHWDGRIKCRGCGLTIDNAIYCGMGAKTNKAQGKMGTKKAKKKYMSKRQRKRYESKNKQHPNKIR